MFYLSIYQSIYLSIYIVYLIYLSICLSLYIYIYIYIHTFICTHSYNTPRNIGHSFFKMHQFPDAIESYENLLMHGALGRGDNYKYYQVFTVITTIINSLLIINFISFWGWGLSVGDDLVGNPHRAQIFQCELFRSQNLSFDGTVGNPHRARAFRAQNSKFELVLRITKTGS